MQKIMIIEDSNLIRLQIKNALKNHGYDNVVGFNSAEYVLENQDFLLSEISLIISDIGLPGTSGVEFAQQLNDNPNYSNIPIIFLTSYKDANTVNSAIKAGGVDYILKPFNEDVLIDRVKSILGKPFEEETSKLRINTEEAQDMVAMEYDRAARGGQSVSFIVYDVHQNNLEQATLLIQELLRQIDMVYIIDNQIFIILPVTSEEGVRIVKNKIKNALQQNKIDFEENNTVSFQPKSKKTLGILLNELFNIEN